MLLCLDLGNVVLWVWKHGQTVILEVALAPKAILVVL